MREDVEERERERNAVEKVKGAMRRDEARSKGPRKEERKIVHCMRERKEIERGEGEGSD